MMTSRLDNVLRRNRKNAILDLVLVAVLFTGMAFGEELPNLSSAPVATDTVGGQASTAVAAADAVAPVRVARR